MTNLQQIDWILQQFKAMGASDKELRSQFIKLSMDERYFAKTLELLGMEVGA